MKTESTTRRTDTRPDLPDPYNDPRLLAYLRSVNDWHGYVRFLGLPHLHETLDEPILNLFVEPKFSDQYHRPDEPLSAWGKSRYRPIDLFDKKSRVIVLGDPGTGKSTLVSWVAWNFTRWDGGEWLDRFGPLVPIIFVVRELNITRDITWDNLCGKFLEHGMVNGKLTRAELDEIFLRGQAFVLVDGLDELSDLETRKKLRTALADGMMPKVTEEEMKRSKDVVSNIKKSSARRIALVDHLSKQSKDLAPEQMSMLQSIVNTLQEEYVFQKETTCFDPWLLTTRIIGYDEVPYDEVISPLIPDVWRRLSFRMNAFVMGGTGETGKIRSATFSDGTIVEEDSITVKLDRYYCSPFDNEQVDLFARMWFVAREPRGLAESEILASKFLTDLRATAAPMALARVPNLLTLFALVYKVLAEIPHGHSVLYGKVAEAYLESIDKARGLKPRFTRDRMERWLAFLAFHLQIRRLGAADQIGDRECYGEILIDHTELMKLLVEEMPKVGGAPGETEAREFLEFAARRSGLLLPRGEGKFAFMHLSFQEYFAARFLEEQITSLKWARGLPTYPGTSAEDLNNLADNIFWTETMVLLFEILKSKPQWSEALRDALFGEEYVLPNNDEVAEGRVRLLAEILINPHTGLESFERVRGLPSLIDWELRQQQNTQRYDRDFSSRVFPTILLPSGFEPGQRIATFWRCVWHAPDLRRLDLNFCQSLSDLSPLSRLTNLRILELCGCLGVTDLAPLAGLTNLETLNLNSCTSLRDLSPLARLFNLRYLGLYNCSSVTDLAPLASLTHLDSLNLDNSGATDFSPLAQLTRLTTLFMSDCSGLTDLAPLSFHTRLTYLHLNGCTGVTDLTPLAQLITLKVLNLRNCVGVKDLAPLTRLTNLEHLFLKGTGISVIPDELQKCVKSLELP